MAVKSRKPDVLFIILIIMVVVIVISEFFNCFKDFKPYKLDVQEMFTTKFNKKCGSNF